MDFGYKERVIYGVFLRGVEENMVFGSKKRVIYGVLLRFFGVVE